MTEYDYSPQAWERHIATQQRIARWVDDTLTQPPCNAFSPATPHVQALKLKEEKQQRRREERRPYYDDESDVSDDHDSRYARSSQKTATRHRKTHSSKETTSHRPPRRERSKERERDRDKERRDRDRPRDQERTSTRTYKPEKMEKYGRYDADYVWVDRDAPTSASSRPRASSQSVSSKPRVSHSSRTHNIPHLSLDVPPVPLTRQEQYYYHNHRNSHSSQSSATTPNSGSTTHGMFPSPQVPPHSAPPITGQAPRLGGSPPKPLRAQTMPFTYPAGYPHVDKNGYPTRPPAGSQPVVVPIRPTHSGSKSYGAPMAYAPDPSVRSVPLPSHIGTLIHHPFQKAPQFPYSAYQSPGKPPSLLKRMFGFKAKNESIPQPQYQPPPQPTRGDKGSAMFLGGGGGGRQMSRKRSISF